MSRNDKKICEYFLISGFNKIRKRYDLSQTYYQGEEICNANVETATDFFNYKKPIVDIKIVNVSQRERAPDDYHIVDRTYSNNYKADLNGKSTADEIYLCFRYGRDLPPITDIWAINSKQNNIIDIESWTLIEKTMNGHSANLHTSSDPLFIAFKRAPSNAAVDNLIVTNICVILINKNECCPPAYSRVDVPIKRTPFSNIINICYKKSIVKQHVLTYQPEIIYCLSSSSAVPIVDVYHPDDAKCKSPDCLPDDIRDVANFCMPWGATLESWRTELLTPCPSFVTFVLTNINYDRMYGAAMSFYEDFDQRQLTDDEALNLCVSDDRGSHMKVFSSKSICLLSRWPFFQTFNRVLSFLIQEDERQRNGVCIKSSPFNLPLERFISQFLYSVPFPTPVAPNILLQWDLENAIGMQLPTDAISKCGTGENFYQLLCIFDVDQAIQLFVYMLTEQKILLTSTCNSDLVGIAEALISMIFPFKWSVVYIPFLYLSCIHIIQSPSPYLIGVDSRFFDYFRLPEGVGCIDLINKSIQSPDITAKYLDYTKVLPKSVLKSLILGLSTCKSKIESFHQQQSLHKTNGTVSDGFTILRKKEVIGELIRECFLRAVVLMFKNYQQYLLPVTSGQMNADMFNVNGFIKSVEKSSRPLYHAIFETQLWNHFVTDRSYATQFDESLVFFDRCIRHVQQMNEDEANVSSLLHSDRVIKSEHTKVVAPPDPVEGWMADLARTTFPSRLHSSLIVTNISEDGDTQAYKARIASTSQDNDSISSLTSADSSIPVLLIRPDTTNIPPSKTTILKRPLEELKQAHDLGKEAKDGPSYAWACHLLTSSYCLWYTCLPGLIGYITATPGIRESGLEDRILQLSVGMIDSIIHLGLIIPDEVCLRVLLLLVHQLRPTRLHVSDIGRLANLNAFSYGLCNQILLEEEKRLTIMNISEKPGKQVTFTETILQEDVKRETDCGEKNDDDSGRETLGSINNVSSGPLERLEIGGKVARLKGSHEITQKKSRRISQIYISSPLDSSIADKKRSHQFYDRAAGILMSTVSRTSAPEWKRDRKSLAPEISLHTPDSSDKSKDNNQDSAIRLQNERSTNLTQSKSINKTRSSFRLLRNAAYRSLRSVRSVMSSVGSEAYMKEGGMPVTFRPWDQNINNHGNIFAMLEPRIKTTVNPEMLVSTESDRYEKIKPESVNLQQQRRRDNVGEGSIDSWHSEETFGQNSSTNSLDVRDSTQSKVDRSVADVDNIWEKITYSLAAVQLPTGRYWPSQPKDNGCSSSSVECSNCIAVRMTTCSECVQCHCMIYDDDIMSGWSPDDSDLQSVCAYCYHRFTPRLSLQVFISPNPSNSSSDPIPPRDQMILVYKSQINYLSPFVLRKELELVLSQEGEMSLMTSSFVQHHGILYWNLIWFFARLSLPSHLLSFLTPWLQENARYILGQRADSNSKYEIMMTLTGYEQVFVSVLWEINQLSGRAGLPLYRQYLANATSSRLHGLVPPSTRPNKSFMDQVVAALFSNDLVRAIHLVLTLRSYSKTAIHGVSTLPLATSHRSVYRELMHLAIVSLAKHGLDIDTFHHMYTSHWERATKTTSELVLAHDKPPSDNTFNCRKFFRPLLLVSEQ